METPGISLCCCGSSGCAFLDLWVLFNYSSLAFTEDSVGGAIMYVTLE